MTLCKDVKKQDNGSINQVNAGFKISFESMFAKLAQASPKPSK